MQFCGTRSRFQINKLLFYKPIQGHISQSQTGRLSFFFVFLLRFFVLCFVYSQINGNTTFDDRFERLIVAMQTLITSQIQTHRIIFC